MTKIKRVKCAEPTYHTRSHFSVTILTIDIEIEQEVEQKENMITTMIIEVERKKI